MDAAFKTSNACYTRVVLIEKDAAWRETRSR
jgi:hypothetical protein